MYLLPQICVCLGVQLAVDPPPAEKIQLPHLLEESATSHLQSAEGVDVIVVID